MISAIYIICLLFKMVLCQNECIDPRSYGAIEGNPNNGYGENWETNQIAIQRAIDEAGDLSSINDRHCVIITGGDYVTSDLILRSNIIFKVDENSRVITAATKTTTALVLIQDIENVEIVGPGVIYGNAEYYIDYYDDVDNRYEPIAADGSRPRLLYMITSSNIFVHDISIQNASDWHVHAQGCKNVSIDHVSVYGDSRFPNNDGMYICISMLVVIVPHPIIHTIIYMK